jgi:carbamoyltransferase
MVLGRFPPAFRLLSASANPHMNVPAVIRFFGVAGGIARAFDAPQKPKVRFVPHHLAHACNAFFLSPFDRSAILIMDGFGDECSTSSYQAQGCSIQTLNKNEPLNSLGILYAIVTKHLGFRTVRDEGTVMALAAYGSDEVYGDFRKLIRLLPAGGYQLREDYFQFYRYGEPRAVSDRFIRRFGAARLPHEPLTQRHRNLAYALQRAVEDTVLHAARYLRESTGEENLCLGGGVALNCLVNTRIAREAGFERVYVSPSPNDAGLPLGAALAVAHLDRRRRAAFLDSRKSEGATATLGPRYSDKDLKSALMRRGLSYREEPHVVEFAASELARGRVVAWFQDAAEMGPRALGNRSILADPRNPSVSDRLNRDIKKRELFRPFGPSVLAEHAGDFLEEEFHSPYMSFAIAVRDQQKAKIPAVVARDGTARVHTVTKHQNPTFYALIEAFYRRTEIPVLLNTSFNVREPIVCTPADAVGTFTASTVDTLIMGNYVVTR